MTYLSLKNERKWQCKSATKTASSRPKSELFSRTLPSRLRSGCWWFGWSVTARTAQSTRSQGIGGPEAAGMPPHPASARQEDSDRRPSSAGRKRREVTKRRGKSSTCTRSVAAHEQAGTSGKAGHGDATAMHGRSHTGQRQTETANRRQQREVWNQGHTDRPGRRARRTSRPNQQRATASHNAENSGFKRASRLLGTGSAGSRCAHARKAAQIVKERFILPRLCGAIEDTHPAVAKGGPLFKVVQVRGLSRLRRYRVGNCTFVTFWAAG